MRDAVYRRLVIAEKTAAWAEKYAEQTRLELEDARREWEPYASVGEPLGFDVGRRANR